MVHHWVTGEDKQKHEKSQNESQDAGRSKHEEAVLSQDVWWAQIQQVHGLDILEMNSHEPKVAKRSYQQVGEKDESKANEHVPLVVLLVLVVL